MATVFDNLINHITDTLRRPPAATLAKWPELRTGFLVHADNRAGGRLELEQMVGQSRVFEVDLEARRSEALTLGGAVPVAFTDTLPVLVRYDGQGPHSKQQILSKLINDQQCIIDALTRSGWAGVTGVVSLLAEPGDVTRFELADDVSGKHYEGYIGEVMITASYDI